MWAVIVLDSPSQESLRYLSLNMSDRYLLRFSSTSRYLLPCSMSSYISASSGPHRPGDVIMHQPRFLVGQALSKPPPEFGFGMARVGLGLLPGVGLDDR